MANRKKPKPAAEPDAEELAYRRWIETVPISWRIARSRKIQVECCRKTRQWIKEGQAPNPDVDLETMRKFLRHSQLALLKLRAWRATGTYPGNT